MGGEEVVEGSRGRVVRRWEGKYDERDGIGSAFCVIDFKRISFHLDHQ